MKNTSSSSYNFYFVDEYLKKLEKPTSQILNTSNVLNDNNDTKLNSKVISQKTDQISNAQKSHTIKMLNNSYEKTSKLPQTPSNLDKMMDKINDLLKTHDEIREISSSKLNNSQFSSEKPKYTRSFLDEAETPKKKLSENNKNKNYSTDFLKDLNNSKSPLKLTKKIESNLPKIIDESEQDDSILIDLDHFIYENDLKDFLDITFLNELEQRNEISQQIYEKVIGLERYLNRKLIDFQLRIGQAPLINCFSSKITNRSKKEKNIILSVEEIKRIEVILKKILIKKKENKNFIKEEETFNNKKHETERFSLLTDLDLGEEKDKKKVIEIQKKDSFRKIIRQSTSYLEPLNKSNKIDDDIDNMNGTRKKITEIYLEEKKQNYLESFIKNCNGLDLKKNKEDVLSEEESKIKLLNQMEYNNSEKKDEKNFFKEKENQINEDSPKENDKEKTYEKPLNNINSDDKKLMNKEEKSENQKYNECTPKDNDNERLENEEIIGKVLSSFSSEITDELKNKDEISEIHEEVLTKENKNEKQLNQYNELNSSDNIMNTNINKINECNSKENDEILNDKESISEKKLKLFNSENNYEELITKEDISKKIINSDEKNEIKLNDGNSKNNELALLNKEETNINPIDIINLEKDCQALKEIQETNEYNLKHDYKNLKTKEEINGKPLNEYKSETYFEELKIINENQINEFIPEKHFEDLKEKEEIDEKPKIRFDLKDNNELTDDEEINKKLLYECCLEYNYEELRKKENTNKNQSNKYIHEKKYVKLTANVEIEIKPNNNDDQENIYADLREKVEPDLKNSQQIKEKKLREYNNVKLISNENLDISSSIHLENNNLDKESKKYNDSEKKISNLDEKNFTENKILFNNLETNKKLNTNEKEYMNLSDYLEIDNLEKANKKIEELTEMKASKEIKNLMVCMNSNKEFKNNNEYEKSSNNLENLNKRKSYKEIIINEKAKRISLENRNLGNKNHESLISSEKTLNLQKNSLDKEKKYKELMKNENENENEVFSSNFIDQFSNKEQTNEGFLKNEIFFINSSNNNLNYNILWKKGEELMKNINLANKKENINSEKKNEELMNNDHPNLKSSNNIECNYPQKTNIQDEEIDNQTIAKEKKLLSSQSSSEEFLFQEKTINSNKNTQKEENTENENNFKKQEESIKDTQILNSNEQKNTESNKTDKDVNSNQDLYQKNNSFELKESNQILEKLERSNSKLGTKTLQTLQKSIENQILQPNIEKQNENNESMKDSINNNEKINKTIEKMEIITNIKKELTFQKNEYDHQIEKNVQNSKEKIHSFNLSQNQIIKKQNTKDHKSSSEWKITSQTSIISEKKLSLAQKQSQSINNTLPFNEYTRQHSNIEQNFEEEIILITNKHSKKDEDLITSKKNSQITKKNSKILDSIFMKKKSNSTNLLEEEKEIIIESKKSNNIFNDEFTHNFLSESLKLESSKYLQELYFLFLQTAKSKFLKNSQEQSNNYKKTLIFETSKYLQELYIFSLGKVKSKGLKNSYESSPKSFSEKKLTSNEILRVLSDTKANIRYQKEALEGNMENSEISDKDNSIQMTQKKPKDFDFSLPKEEDSPKYESISNPPFPNFPQNNDLFQENSFLLNSYEKKSSQINSDAYIKEKAIIPQNPVQNKIEFNKKESHFQRPQYLRKKIQSHDMIYKQKEKSPKESKGIYQSQNQLNKFRILKPFKTPSSLEKNKEIIQNTTIHSIDNNNIKPIENIAFYVNNVKPIENIALDDNNIDPIQNILFCEKIIKDEQHSIKKSSIKTNNQKNKHKNLTHKTTIQFPLSQDFQQEQYIKRQSHKNFSFSYKPIENQNKIETSSEIIKNIENSSNEKKIKNYENSNLTKENEECCNKKVLQEKIHKTPQKKMVKRPLYTLNKAEFMPKILNINPQKQFLETLPLKNKEKFMNYFEKSEQKLFMAVAKKYLINTTVYKQKKDLEMKSELLNKILSKHTKKKNIRTKSAMPEKKKNEKKNIIEKYTRQKSPISAILNKREKLTGEDKTFLWYKSYLQEQQGF